jgi:hypothetical protein
MSSDTNKWYTKWWVSGLILPIAATILGTGSYDFLKEKPIFSTLLYAFFWIWNKILELINFQLRLWHIFLIVLGFIIIREIIQAIKKRNIESEPELKFLNYKNDRLKIWKWTWDYRINSNTMKYEIRNLQPICENCDIKMLSNASFGRSASNYKCPKCDRARTEYEYGFEYQSDIEALIIHNIERGEIGSL